MRFTALSFALLLFFSNSYPQVCETVGSGQWNSAGTWSCDGAATIPDGTISRVLIREGHTVFISNYDATFNGELAVWGGLQLTDVGFGPFSRLFMDASSFVDIHAGASVSVDNAATCFCRISIGTNTFVFSPLFGGGSNPEVGPQSISQAGYSSLLLPIVLKDFIANIGDRSVSLQWQTVSETNFSHFEIEKSPDGEDFFKIGKVNGFGESNDLRNYSYQDNYPIQGNNFYRLKQVDHDGTFEYSKIITETYNSANKTIAIYPNPIKNNILNLNLNFVPSEKSLLSVYDNYGRLVHKQMISKVNTPSDLNGKLNGNFFHVKVESNGNIYYSKFIKE